MKYVWLSTSASNYQEILDTQKTAFNKLPWATNFVPRLSLDWSKALIQIFWEEPKNYLIAFNTPQEVLAYWAEHYSEWVEQT